MILNGTNFMPNLEQFIINQGITFTNSYVATPICCPSRSELLTGLYYQNIYIGEESGNCMHVDATNSVYEDNSLFQKFYEHGYLTGMFGKLTNS